MSADTIRSRRWKITVVEMIEIEESAAEYQKVADTGNPRDGRSVYEYVPAVVRRQREVKRYEQETDTLDVVAVIRAVNGLGPIWRQEGAA